MTRGVSSVDRFQRASWHLVRARLAAIVVAASWLALASGCVRELYHDLDERAANEAVLALSQAGIAAEKRAGSGGGWTLVTAASQHDRSLAVLHAEGLPRSASDGVELLEESGLVPSARMERAREEIVVGERLADTLRGLPDVLDARVHVVLGDGGGTRPRLGAAPTPPRAAVVVVAADGRAGPTEASVRQLVAGAVAGLAAEDVSILQTTAPPTTAPASEIVRVGPFAVASESAPLLRGTVAALAVFNLVLLGLLIALFLRGRMRASTGGSASVHGAPDLSRT